MSVAPVVLKNCRFCAEEIRDEAVLCRHCGREQDPESAPLGARPVVKAAENLGALLLLIPVVFTLFAFFWVGNMALIDGPAAKLSFLAVAMVVSTAVIAWMEAKKLGMGSETDLTKKGKRRTAPGVWMAAMLITWAIAFPIYFFSRSRHGARNLGVLGILVTVLALLALFSVNAAITDAQRQLADILSSF